MKDLFSLLTQSLWLMEENWLKALVASLPDIKAARGTLIKDFEMTSDELQMFGSTAVIPIKGPIFARPNIITELLGIGCSLPKLMTDLKAAGSDSKVERIVIDIDTPGGTVVGVNESANAIRKLNANKPVDFYVGGQCCSAGYWLASQGNKIFVDATAGVGSIGVVAVVPKKEKGDEVEIVNSASPNKRPDPETKEGKEVILSMVDDLASVFMEAVASGRGVSVDKIKSDFGKGGILIGQRAVDAGMVDGISSFDEVVGMQTNPKGGSMDLKTLKAEHPDLIGQLVAEVTASMSGEIQALKDSVAAKDKEATEAKAALEAKSKEADDLQTQNTALDERTKSLEKKDTIRTQKEIAQEAKGIFEAKLAKSQISASLHKKVIAQIDHNKYVDDKGTFNAEAFAAAVDAEIKDWEDSLSAEGASPVFLGGSNFSREVVGTEDAKPEAVADRLLAHLGIKTEKK